MDADQKRSRLDEIKARLAQLYEEEERAIAANDQRRVAELQTEITEASRERAAIIREG